MSGHIGPLCALDLYGAAMQDCGAARPSLPALLLQELAPLSEQPFLWLRSLDNLDTLSAGAIFDVVLLEESKP